jgi:hypothetical protein
MNAGFFRRLFSSIIDLTLVFVIIYFSFALFGQSMLQGKIENFDEIDAAYTEIMTVYNDNLSEVQREYDVNRELAQDDEELQAQALEVYLEKVDILEQQNLVDTAPYDGPLGLYFTSVVYYYMFIFLVLMSIYTVAFKGSTLGRKIMRLKLEGPVNFVTVFLHDIAFKYLLIIVLIPINPLFAIMLIMFMFLIDTGLIAATRNKNTIRDMITKVTVERTEYKY